jgi:hypothetical protein
MSSAEQFNGFLLLEPNGSGEVNHGQWVALLALDPKCSMPLFVMALDQLTGFVSVIDVLRNVQCRAIQRFPTARTGVQQSAYTCHDCRA